MAQLVYPTLNAVRPIVSLEEMLVEIVREEEALRLDQAMLEPVVSLAQQDRSNVKIVLADAVLMARHVYPTSHVVIR